MTLKAMEVTVTPDGRIDNKKPLPITRPTRVILTMIAEDADENPIDLALASEGAWGKDWNDSDEEKAWAYLQEETSS